MTNHVLPVWENKTAPCGGEGGCPANTNIAASLHALSTGDALTAWKIMMETHPFRSVLGRVCYGFCETPCNRGKFDTPISIQALEAVIGDNGFDDGWAPEKAPANGQKVVVIGAGPAGLTAAWYLTLAGFTVGVHESAEKPGGVLQYGIPSYRLPKHVLDREIAYLVKYGVTIITGSRVTPESLGPLMEKEGYTSAVIAIGAGKSRLGGFPGEDSSVNGLEFLRRVNSGEVDKTEFEGKNVAVIGGGNVAMDASRCAIRLGAKSVTVYYRRNEELMPAHDHEVSQAKKEGAVFEYFSAPSNLAGSSLTLEKMSLAANNGYITPTGATYDVIADIVIMAIGQTPTEYPVEQGYNLYFAGDANEDSPGTVIHAIADGKSVASKIYKRFSGKPMFAEIGEEVTYEKMNVSRYFEPKQRLRLQPVRHPEGFEPVDPVATLEEGVLEADRCFRCGLCVGGLNSACDWCFRACDPGKGLKKHMVEWNHTGPLFSLSQEDCDTCGKCWEDCPRYVVTPQRVGDS